MDCVTTTIRCGSTVHLLAARNSAELDSLTDRMIRKLLKPNGHALCLPCGRTVWIIDEEIHPSVWDSAGNKIRGRRCRIEVDAGGKMTKTFLRLVWVSPV